MNLQESIKNHRLMWDKVISIMENAHITKLNITSIKHLVIKSYPEFIHLHNDCFLCDYAFNKFIECISEPYINLYGLCKYCPAKIHNTDICDCLDRSYRNLKETWSLFFNTRLLIYKNKAIEIAQQIRDIPMKEDVE